MVNLWKIRIEGTGLVISFAGLASILQPFNYTMYNLGFYTLAFGAAIYFLGSTIPDEAQVKRIIIQVLALTTTAILVMFLAVYLAPLLVSP